MKKVAYFTNIAPHYRELLWLKILELKGFDFHFFFGNPSKAGIKAIEFSKGDWSKHDINIHKVQNFRVKGRLIFQFGILSKVLFNRWEVCVFLGDPNLISTWITSFLAKIFGIRVIFWGHGIYGSERGLNLAIRKIFLSIPDLNLVYGNWAKMKMIEAGLEASKIDVIYNSLDYDQSLKLRNDSIEKDFFIKKGIFQDSNPVLIFIGRLTKQKKIHLILDAIGDLKNKGNNFNLLIVGEGSEKEILKESSKKYGPMVQFFGACYDENMISKLIANADLCVSPGNVGLTAIHALSYGTPVCTHNNFTKQMPEVEAILDGETGCFFDFEKMNLTEAISNWFSKNKDRKVIRENCYLIIDRFYNPNNQVKILSKVLTNNSN